MADLIVVDDEPDIRQLVGDYLSLAGHEVRMASDGQDLRRQIGEAVPDLVLLDVGLPGESGFQVARHLRERYGCGIVMLTGADTVIDRVVGLEVGADDYVTKPFDLKELKARIEAVLRRRRPRGEPLAPGIVPFGPFRFDTKRFRLLGADGAEVALAPMELDLVAAFASRPGRALGREELLKLAPPRGDDAFDRSIDNRITRLRRKLERDPEKPELIKTLRGAGYIYPG
ncbi:MAG: response regulator transcription factor [Geminicoccaceae bacterium]